MGGFGRVGVAACVAALAAALMPAVGSMADTAPVAVFVESFVIPSGLAGGCLPAGPCIIDNGTVGSDCNEYETGEGLDGFLCQAFIAASVTVSGCSVNGAGSLTFTEDSPPQAATGGTFDFTVSGTIDDAVMRGTNPGPGGGMDVTLGKLSLGSNCVSSGTALYTASATHAV